MPIWYICHIKPYSYIIAFSNGHEYDYGFLGLPIYKDIKINTSQYFRNTQFNKIKIRLNIGNIKDDDGAYLMGHTIQLCPLTVKNNCNLNNQFDAKIINKNDLYNCNTDNIENCVGIIFNYKIPVKSGKYTLIAIDTDKYGNKKYSDNTLTLNILDEPTVNVKTDPMVSNTIYYPTQLWVEATINSDQIKELIDLNGYSYFLCEANSILECKDKNIKYNQGCPDNYLPTTGSAQYCLTPTVGTHKYFIIFKDNVGKNITISLPIKIQVLSEDTSEIQ
jgi:hypothetical protein